MAVLNFDFRKYPVYSNLCMNKLKNCKHCFAMCRMEIEMIKFTLILVALLVCNISSSAHLRYEWKPEGPEYQPSVAIVTSAEEKNELISFILSVSENPEYGDGKLHALSKYSYGRLEIFDGKKKLADVTMEGEFTYDNKREFKFQIHKDFLNDSIFTFATYPVDPNVDPKNPQIPMYGNFYYLKLVKFYKTHLNKDTNKAISINAKQP